MRGSEPQQQSKKIPPFPDVATAATAAAAAPPPPVSEMMMVRIFTENVSHTGGKETRLDSLSGGMG